MNAFREQAKRSAYIAEPSWLGEFIRPEWPGYVSRNARRLAGALRRAACIGICVVLVDVRTQSASAALLSNLLAGDSVVAGNARFHAWELISLDATGPPTPNLALVSVLPLVDDLAQPGLQFVGNGQLATTGLNALDLVLKFQVQAVPGGNSFTGHTLSMTGADFGGNGGVAYISEEAVAVAGADLGPNLAIADNESGALQLSDGGGFAAHLNVSVTMNIFLSGHSGADAVTLSTFSVRYAQSGPASLSGDFDQDGTVDGADFLKWQRGQSPGPLSPADLTAWRTHFGQSIAATPTASPVPEPNVTALLIIAACLARHWRSICPN